VVGFHLSSGVFASPATSDIRLQIICLLLLAQFFQKAKKGPAEIKKKIGRIE